MVLRDERQLTRFLKVFVILGIVSVGIAVVQRMAGTSLLTYQLSMGVLAGKKRAGALLGSNTLGLVSGLMCLLGMIQYCERPFRGSIGASWFPLVGGILGLILSKSFSSTLATAVVVGIYWLSHSKLDLLVLARWGLTIFLGLAVLFVFLRFFRPSDFQGFFNMTEGSYVHRSIMMLAGIRIFLEHPLFGVGWRGSSFSEVLMGPELNQWLRNIFPLAPAHYFPDMRPTSVHSFYLQILADFGLVGLLVFLATVAYLTWVIVKITRKLKPDSPLKGFGKFFALAIVFLLVWWVAHNFYGGQIETFLLFTFLGGLAALPSIGRQER
jgi:O-antigen ligase